MKSKLAGVSISDLGNEHVSTLAVVARMIATEMERRIVTLNQETKNPGLRRRP